MKLNINYSKGIFYLTLLLAIFAFLNYFFPIRKALIDKIEDMQIKEFIKEEKKNISLSLDKEIYRGERNWLLKAFSAATKMYSIDAQDENLHKVVVMSIELNDFNMAVIAAKKINNYIPRNISLMEIVNAAVKDANNFGYAILAAEEIFGYEMRTIAVILHTLLNNISIILTYSSWLHRVFCP